ncbi:MAG: hypothetical protein ACI910_001753 [Oleispira sp.]|jgi:hypothetical protein
MKFKKIALIVAASTISVSAYAQTEYNLDVTNTANLSYTSGSDNRTAISNEVTFKVDRKVIFSFTEVNSGSNAQTVAPGDTTYSEYTLTNFSNAPIDYNITAPSGTAPFTVSFLIENGLTPGPSADDTVIAGPIALAAYDGITDVTETIYVQIITDAVTAVDGDAQLYTLTATAAEPVGTLIAGASAGDIIVAATAADPWIEGTVQTVADDILGTVRTETGTYTVGAAIIALVKSVLILSDPVSGPASITVFPKAIPGAIVQYTLTITNTGHAPATVELTDLLSDKFDQSGTIASSEIDGIGPAAGASLVAALPTEILLGFDQLLTIPNVTVIAVPANDIPPEQTKVVTFEVVLK